MSPKPLRCPTCARPVTPKPIMVCAKCARPIRRGHKYTIRAGVIAHRHCSDPTDAHLTRDAYVAAFGHEPFPVIAPVAFSFDPVDHAYYIGDARVPSITQMLEATGHTDSTWFTDDGRERGTAIHDLAAAYDLGALDLVSVQGRYRPWLLAHAEAMTAIRPLFHAIEEADVHPHYRFGGRPDRVLTVFNVRGVLDIKTGAPSKADQLQTALQAILVAWRGRLLPESYARRVLYLTEGGRYKLVSNTDRRDFDRAYEIIKETCHGV